MEAPQLNLSSDLRGRVEKLSLDFLARFYETALARRPETTEALVELGHVYTQQGRLQDGLSIDERLVRLFPDDPTVHYNLACSLALLDRRDAALDALEKAVRLGYRDAGFMQNDPDLATLLEEERFTRLVARIAVGATGQSAAD